MSRLHNICFRCYQETQQREKLVDSALGVVSLTVLETLLTHTHHQLLPSDLDPGVVSVTGVLLPRLSDNTSTHGSVLVGGVFMYDVCKVLIIMNGRCVCILQFVS